MQIVLWALLGLAALLVGKELSKWLFGAKKTFLGSKRAAQSLAIAFRSAGLTWLPVILEEYVVGDATSLFKSIDEAAAVVRNGNDAIMRELEGTFERVLDMKLSTPEGRALVKAKLDLAVAIATPAVKEIVKAAAVAAL